MLRAQMAPREKGGAGGALTFRQPGGFAVTNMTVRQMLRFAYQPVRVQGGPVWIDSERFTFDEPVPRSGELAAWDVPRLLQGVIERRFGLVLRREQRELPGYVLTLAHADGSLGPNLRRSTEPCAPRGPLPCGSVEAGLFGTSMRGVTMARVVDMLDRSFGLQDERPVVDRTGLAGTFDVDFEYFPPVQALANDHPQLAAFLGVTPIADRLVQQLGLRLEAMLTPQNVVIVDRATRPQP